MAIRWSKEQELAIKSHGHNELLNAGAGSGKTAVLSEHVIYLLHNGYKLNDLLIMTFTNAAANEMKQRIKKKIQQDPELDKLYSDEVEAAHIQTFDAFYLFIVKKYHYVFGLDKDINIFDGNLIPVLYARMINQVMDEYYARHDPIFEHMVVNFCVKNDDVIKKVVKGIIDQSHLEVNKNEFFSHFLEKYFSDEFISSLIDERYKNMLNELAFLKDKAIYLEDDEDRASICNFLDTFDECQNYDELFYKTRNSEFPRKVGARSTVDSEFRKAIKGEFDDTFLDSEVNFGNTDTIFELHRQMEKYAKVCVAIAKEVEDRMDAYKREHNAFLFSDISMMAMELFDDPQILKEIKDTFKYILVDEYQDTNDVQEAVLQKISDNNLFMVGDVKQSIYRFRHANCMIFQNKYNDYKHNGVNGHVIDMTNNFRSRKGLIEDFNSMFSQLMTPKTNQIDYMDGHITNYGFTEYSKYRSRNTNDRITILNYPESPDANYNILEAQMVADDIITKINTGYGVYDPDFPGYFRKCTFKDFAIIMDRGSQFDTFRRIFAERNIPLFTYADENAAQNTIFLLAPNLLKVYLGVKNHDYSGDFNHAYASVARSFLVRTSDEELYNTIKNNDYDNSSIVSKFKEIILKHDNESVLSIFEAILEKFDLYLKIASIGNYNEVVADIDSFKTLIDNLDKLNFSLQECIDYFKDIKHYDAEIKTSPIKESDNSVTLLNVHKSKGLEFRICYFAGFGLAFNRTDITSHVAISKEFGFILPVFGKNKEVLLARYLYKNYETQQDFEERLRILYVALTRAREAAIIIQRSISEPKIKFHMNKCTCYRDILEFVKFDHKVRKEIGSHSVGKNFLIYNESPLNKQTDLFKLLEKPVIKYQEVEKIRASKVAGDEVDVDALDFGNKMHAYLEKVDMDKKDLSFIDNRKERKYIQKVINLPIFAGLTSENIRHEFPFYDENKKTLGFIDCLIIKDEEIDIIDYKLKNIDDDAYKKQLKVYYDYINTIKKDEQIVKTFLISILNGTCKEVKMDE